MDGVVQKLLLVRETLSIGSHPVWMAVILNDGGAKHSQWGALWCLNGWNLIAVLRMKRAKINLQPANEGTLSCCECESKCVRIQIGIKSIIYLLHGALEVCFVAVTLY